MASIPSRAVHRSRVGDEVDDALRNARAAIERLRATLAALRPAANTVDGAEDDDPSTLPTKLHVRPYH
ncbi:MAG TPA: hypothetical protein VIG99_31465 [Myxococcaceae bacterium]|jgi:hypothetical protein